MGTIRDEIDKRDTAFRSRSSKGAQLRTQDARYLGDGSVVYSFDDATCNIGWLQQTFSIDHKRWISAAKTGRYPRDLGGPFLTTKMTVSLPSRKSWALRSYNVTSGRTLYSLDGDLFPHVDVHRLTQAINQGKLNTQTLWIQPDFMLDSDLRVLGEKIMLSVVPTSAAFDAVTALGEPISDGGFFGLPGRGLLNGDIGGEFLNTVFGVLPTTSDVKNFNTALDTYDKVIKQYHRDADKLIRRRTKAYQLPEVVTTETQANLAPITVGARTVAAAISANGSVQITTRLNRKVWYSGAFKYHIPEGLSSFEKNLFDWQRAYKIIPDPADIWNLLPFTWLTDWFTNGGNSIRHLFLQASEGATQMYGYAMCQTEVEKTYVWTGQLRIMGTLQAASITAVVHKTIKQRVRVSPFGTSFTGVDLTPRQLAILAALGVAK